MAGTLPAVGKRAEALAELSKAAYVRPVAEDHDFDPTELEEWFESLDDVLFRYGPEKAAELLALLEERAYRHGIRIPFTANTPYINTIPAAEEPEYPGDLEIERRIRSIIRWNAMAMVVRANRTSNVGGHISTFASSATLVDVAQNHFFRARNDKQLGDMVYFQGHAAPGMYARAFVEGRLSEDNLIKFRRELPRGTGLSSYPHPWLMPNFWQFPTVSMGLGPICSIYHARFLRYMEHRGLLDTSQSKVWCFVGDGEVDEPETLGALTLASREHLDNLIWVVNCNLQRLDGPVRGNGKIIQELEAIFRGAGWNCLKVIWGSEWDPILEADEHGELVRRMGEVVDGQYQKYSVESGAYIRDHFFNTPELQQLVAGLTDDQLRKMRRGGHDVLKVYAAYRTAVDHKGAPTVILAKTIKGYGLGEAAEGKNTTHQQKGMNEVELRKFRDRFEIPLSDEKLAEAPFYRPEPDSPEMKYLQARRKELGGYVPVRSPTTDRLPIPSAEEFTQSQRLITGREVSTTMALGEIVRWLMKNKEIGKRIVPIIPDEAQTFGMHTMFAQFGIYSSKGQLYEPVDFGQAVYYREDKKGQILEEGINEAGAMSSFVAAGTAYANLGMHMVPFYVYYSMFGFQRVGDLIWLAADSRCRGFLCGGTSGRTTLNGEGLQHEDGHSQLYASAVPTIKAYDPAYGYELMTIVQEGMRRMYQEGEDVFYYLSVYNENYQMPEMPAGSAEGILKGIYPLEKVDSSKQKGSRPQLFGSGTILPEVRRAQQILSEKFGIESDVWSVTSYNELRRDCAAAERWNSLHPGTKKPQTSFLQDSLAGLKGPFVASSDNVKLLADQIRPWIPGRYTVLGTDGFGRSETRQALRRHFEIDAECVAYATLHALAEDGQFDAKKLPKALKELDIDPEKVDPATA